MNLPGWGLPSSGPRSGCSRRTRPNGSPSCSSRGDTAKYNPALRRSLAIAEQTWTHYLDADPETPEAMIGDVLARDRMRIPLSRSSRMALITSIQPRPTRSTEATTKTSPWFSSEATAYVFEDEAEEDRELAKVLTEINENKPISAIEVLTARIKYGSLFTRQLLSDQISTRFGIVSFTANPHHPLMWSLYKNGRPAATGLCAVCGKKKFRMGAGKS